MHRYRYYFFSLLIWGLISFSCEERPFEDVIPIFEDTFCQDRLVTTTYEDLAVIIVEDRGLLRVDPVNHIEGISTTLAILCPEEAQDLMTCELLVATLDGYTEFDSVTYLFLRGSTLITTCQVPLDTQATPDELTNWKFGGAVVSGDTTWYPCEGETSGISMLEEGPIFQLSGNMGINSFQLEGSIVEDQIEIVSFSQTLAIHCNSEVNSFESLVGEIFSADQQTTVHRKIMGSTLIFRSSSDDLQLFFVK